MVSASLPFNDSVAKIDYDYPICWLLVSTLLRSNTHIPTVKRKSNLDRSIHMLAFYSNFWSIGSMKTKEEPNSYNLFHHFQPFYSLLPCHSDSSINTAFLLSSLQLQLVLVTEQFASCTTTGAQYQSPGECLTDNILVRSFSYLFTSKSFLFDSVDLGCSSLVILRIESVKEIFRSESVVIPLLALHYLS